MSKWLTIPEMLDEYKFLTACTLRGLISNADSNGFKLFLRRLGKKTLINQVLFEDWLNQQKWQKWPKKSKGD